jgi:23S rRNA (guanosine2251-2'-O)-methyltransferase
VSEIIEGRHAVLEALRAELPVSSILLAEGAAEKGLADIVREAHDRGIDVDRVGRRELDELSTRGAHQGVIARLDAFAYASIAEIVSSCEGESRALVVALDGVTDPQNLGAIARTVEVVGGDGLLVTKRRSAAVGAAAFKASAGALAHMPVAREPNLVRALERLKDEGFWVVGASETATESIWELDMPDRMALVVGSEGSGLSRLTEETCDFRVRVPVRGRTESLNVSQATTAVVYEWLRREDG